MIPKWAPPAPCDPFRLFSWGGFTLSSNFKLPRLISASGQEDFPFHWTTKSPSGLPEQAIKRCVPTADGGEVEIWAGRNEKSFAYGVKGLGIFLIWRADNTIQFFAEPLADAMLVEHSLVNSILPIFCGLKGVICLHGAALAKNGEVCVLAGPTGVGKSTFAWRLIREGWDLLADDATVIRQVGGTWCAFRGATTIRIQGLSAPCSWSIRGKTETFAGGHVDAGTVKTISLLLNKSLIDAEPRPSKAAVYRSLIGLQSGWCWADVENRRRLEEQTWQLAQEIPALYRNQFVS